MSISPKLANSTPHQREQGKWAAQHDHLRYQPEVLRELIRQFDYQLKFVVASPGIFAEIEDDSERGGAAADRVLLMAKASRPR